MQNFRELEAPPQTPVPPATGGFAPKSPDPHWRPAAQGGAPSRLKQPPIANFWLRACTQNINRWQAEVVLANQNTSLSSQKTRSK